MLKTWQKCTNVFCIKSIKNNMVCNNGIANRTKNNCSTIYDLKDDKIEQPSSIVEKNH